ncbi:MAG: CinA family nicotinamide mononucleotide deamidase-related protein [Dehalococcoidales bacterium]|nr:CinA family nicotinamide mononucleotide deamidase-related protein [Dehalococcoidales bacterium]
MRAEIIATGTEILLGEIVDTNTSFLAGELAALGIDIHFASSVGDNYERFSGVLRQAWQRSDIIITTGGLGPTQGDITRDVIAAFLSEQTYVDEGLKQNLIDFFSRVGVPMPENNLRQARLIPSAKALLNPLGTAPGWWVEKEGRTIITLPGPPGELKPMWRSQVVPRLQQQSGAVIISRVLKTWGLSESKVDEVTAPLLSSPNPTVAIYARQDGIVLRITAKAPAAEAARELIARKEAEIRGVLQEHVWGVDEDTLAGVVGHLLESKNLTIAVSETLTCGLLAYTLASTPGNTRYFKGGIVINTPEAIFNRERAAELAGNHASQQNAAAMASSVRAQFNADIGIGLDGDAAKSDSVGGAQLGKVFIAIDTGHTEHNASQVYSGRPGQLARRATQQTLYTLRNLLLRP